MNEPIDDSVLGNPKLLAELLYSKWVAKNKEEDPVEQAKKEVELLRIGRQMKEHFKNAKE